ncbi:MAG: VOC family protein [Alphaproteobacteria bacterium]|nr:VOC family protein [Alphaproteobacteria bacterium]
MEARLSFITLAVADIARSRAFYEALGLRASPRSNDFVTFFQLSQGLVLSCFGEQALAHDAGRPGERRAGVGIALAHNVKRREDVAGLLARAEAAGGTITQPAGDTPWGVWRGYFADPDGHAWEVAHNPDVTWDERGGVWMDPPGG